MIKQKKVISLIDNEIKSPSVSSEIQQNFIIDVVYDGEDIDRVATLNNLTVRNVIDIHSIPIYTIAMIGFVPKFPYLLGMDKRLSTPRLDSPRTKIPEKSLAIGGNQTGIYPSESPGGWNLIGHVIQIPDSMKLGDTIKFNEVLS